MPQADGRILLGGKFSMGGPSGQGVFRLYADGSWDTNFLSSIWMQQSSEIVRSLFLQDDGRVVVGGEFNASGPDGLSRGRIVRLNADGTLDTAFDTGTGPNASVDFTWQTARGCGPHLRH